MAARTAKAFTLAELALGVAITAMIALCVVSAGMGLGSAYSKGLKYNQSVQTARVAMTRIESALRKGKVVALVNSNQIVYWQEGRTGDGQIHLSEMVMLQYQNGTVTQYNCVMPPYYQWYYDQPISLDELINDAASYYGYMLTSFFSQPTVLADNLTACSFSTISTPPQCSLVKVHVTAGASGPYQVNLRSQVSLRYSPSVAYVCGEWVFN